MSAVFIYTLSDPITSQIRYVGKTWQSLEKRLRNHIQSSKKLNDHRAKWVNSLLKKNLEPKIEILDFCNREDWKEAEEYWIRILKYLGCNLTNQNYGGMGNNGYSFSEESKRKISQSLKGLKQEQSSIQKRASKLRGRKQSPEHIEKSRQSRLKLNIKLTQEHKDKISKANKNKKLSEEHKLKLLEAANINNKLNSKKVDQFSLSGEFIKTFDSQLQASIVTKTNFGSLRYCLKGKRKKANGFIWRYQYNTDIKNN